MTSSDASRPNSSAALYLFFLFFLGDVRQTLHASGSFRVFTLDAVRMAVLVWMAVIAAFFSSRHVKLLAS